MTKPAPHRRRTTHLRGASRGFTLLETMLAMAVFLVGFVAIARMQLLSSQQLAAAGHKERATQLLASLVDVARVLPEAQLQGLRGTKVLQYDVDGRLLSAADVARTFYTLRATATVQSNFQVQVYSLAVDVRWTEPFSAAAQRVDVVAWLPST